MVCVTHWWADVDNVHYTENACKAPTSFGDANPTCRVHALLAHYFSLNPGQNTQSSALLQTRPHRSSFSRLSFWRSQKMTHLKGC